MRLLVRASVAACLMASVLVAPVSAAGGPPINSFDATTAFSFTDRGVEWSGYVRLADDRLNGIQRAVAFFARLGPERVCEAGTPDEYVSNDSIEFFGEKLVIDAKVRDDLTLATFEILAIGHKTTYDACTGEIVSSRNERHSFDGKLTGTGEITTEVDDVDVLLPDGTVVPGTRTFDQRAADAKLKVDRIAAVVTDASINHNVTVPNG